MREAEAIITEYEKAKSSGLGCILATVVHVEGSSYRRAGARMLVDEHGQMTGAISGGCLEGDALKKALHALHQRKNKLITYDTSDEDDAIIGAQLGCNGVIQVLFEPIDFSNPNNPIELLRQAIQMDQTCVLVTLFNLDKAKDQQGTTLLLDSAMTAKGTHDLIDQIRIDAEMAIAHNQNQFRQYEGASGSIHAFIELITPPPTLVIVGAGNDAQILAQMAELLGWNIVVTEGRPSHANKNRFQGSCQVFVSKPENVLQNIDINDRTFFVLITHNYQYDLAVLKLLINQPAIPYIGILGPKKKYQRMLDDLKTSGVYLSEKQHSIIHAPVGLELGAETASEIALSILAEIQSELTGTSGTQLRTRTEPIHKRMSELVVTQI